MKKLIYILPIILVFGCTSDLLEIEPYSNEPIDIFEVQSSVVNDGDTFNINLDLEGEYKLSLVDEFTNITYTNEVFDGKVGVNTLNIYTKSLPKGSYKLIIKDSDDKPIKQTTIKL
jgi:hypothetical protein